MIMLSPSPDAKGGIASVVENYHQLGLFAKWGAYYIPTHTDGSFLKKISILAWSLLRFLRVILSQDIRLVHVHTSSRRSFFRKSLFFVLCRFFRIPYLVHLHGSEFMTFYRTECSWLGKRLVHSVFSHAGAVLVLSTTWAEAVRPFSTPAPRYVVPNPIRFAGVRPGTRNGFSLLFTGRLGQRKGVFDLVEAFSRVSKQVPAAHLACCGDGQVFECRQRVEALGLSQQVDVPGWVEADELQHLLAVVDIFVLPSYDEGLPMSLLEAMAAELVVVTTPVGGIPDLIEDGVNGFLVQPGDIDGLATRLITLLTSPEQRLAIAAKARETVTQRFSAEQVQSKLEEVYRHFGLEPRQEH
ncbi:glycosyltransferase family 4 protein [Desulfobulbus sp.]|uniref:glycosyltransferase family 4 protein n=1 Tax=Desulfobulbus sp. TaxID=895 RepID=UPI0027B8A040|nr:glycosyltransferase family 4 protein [Desulfobulbus sp.]